MFKKLITICLVLTFSIGILAPVAYAADPPNCSDIYKFETLQLSTKERDKLKLPTIDNATLEKELSSMPFYVVLEEPIGGDDPEKGIITCFRRCELKPILNDAGEVESSTTACSYVELSDATGTDKTKNCPLDDLKISCERVQILIATSGLDLFYNYIGMIYKWAATTIGIIAVLIIVGSGVSISMSNGDSAKIEEAKKYITQSIVGLVILFLSGLILYTINPTFFV